MINNYNSLRIRLGTILKTREPDVVGQPPNVTSSKSRWSWLTSIFILLTVLTGSNVWSQVSNYSFASAGDTYTPISSGINMEVASTATSPFDTQFFHNGTNGLNGTTTAGTYNAFPIGFNFTYDGQTFDGFYIGTDGWIKLGSTSGSAVGSAGSTPISTTTTNTNNIISALGADLSGSLRVGSATRTSGSNVFTITGTSVAVSPLISVGMRIVGSGIPNNTTVTAVSGNTITMSANATSGSTFATAGFVAPDNISYSTTGTVGSRVLTVQWKNAMRWFVFGDLLNFQIKLYEGTNQIQVVYNTTASATLTNSTTMQVGLKGTVSPLTFNNRTGSGSTAWTASSLGTISSSTIPFQGVLGTGGAIVPTAGLTYTWTPPSPCTGSPLAGTVSPAIQNVCLLAPVSTLTASGLSSGVTGLTFKWQLAVSPSDPNLPESWSDISPAQTNTTYSPPVYGGTTVYYRLVTTCTASGFSTPSAYATVTAPNNPATQVSNAVASTVTVSGFNLAWTNGNGTRRVVILSDSPIVDPTNAIGAAALAPNPVYSGSGQQVMFDGTLSTVSISGLAVGTSYNVKVYEYTRCGSGPYDYYYNTSTGTNATSVTTCNAVSLPVPSETFTSLSLPACWGSAILTGTTNWGVTTTNDGVPSARTGSNFMGKTWNNSDAIVFSQPVNMTTSPSGARIDVWIYRNTVNFSSDRIRFHVNTVPSLTGATQLLEIFPLVSVAPVVASAGWYNYKADIPSGFNSSTALFIIAQGTTSGSFSSYGIGFDDLIIEPIPNCIAPTGLTVTNVGGSSADLAWTATASATGGYEWAVTTSATPPASGTTELGTTASASGLSGNTLYYLHVRSNCDANGFSAWNTSASFRTALSCGDVFVDSGGAGEYSNSENLNYSFAPASAGQSIVLTFTSFNTESGWDFLRVYDGPNASSTLLGSFSGTSIPGPFVSSHPTGQLYVVFTSDGSGTRPGWSADVTCQSPCTGTPAPGSIALTSQSVCPGIPVAPLTVTGADSGNGISYQWEESVNGGSSWANVTGGTGATTLTYSPPVFAGTPILYRLRVTCSTGPNSDVSNTSEINSNSRTVPFTESFTNINDLTGWSVLNFSIGTTSGVAGNPGNSAYGNLYGSVITNQLNTAKYGPVTAGQALVFDYQLSNWADPYGPPAADTGNFEVFVSTDCAATFTSLGVVVNDGVAGYRNKTFSLSSYVGQDVVIRIVGNWISGDYNLSIDNLGILIPPPSITDFTPIAVCESGDTVTINGANFDNVSAVLVGSTPAAFNVVNPTTITFVVPVGATSDLIYVTTPGGTVSSAANLTINPFPTNNPITGPDTKVCTNGTLQLVPGGAGNAWTSSDDLIATVDGNGLVTGVASGTVTISFSITDFGCTTTQTYDVDVLEGVTITTQPPLTKSIQTGTNSSISVVATGDGLTYQWFIYDADLDEYVEVVADATFSDVDTATLVITNTPVTLNEAEFYCEVFGAAPCGSEISGSTLLSVGSTAIVDQPTNQTVCDSGSVTFSVTTSGAVEPGGYIWYENSGLGFEPVSASTSGLSYSGNGTASLTVSGITAANNGYSYYVFVDGTANDVSSSAASLIVNSSPAVTVQASNAVNCVAGGSSTFTIESSGTVGSFEWQYATSASGPWSPVANGTPTAATYTATATSLVVATTNLTPVSTYYYQVVLNGVGSCPSATSDVASLTINNPTVSNPAAATVLRGNTATFTSTVVATAPVYQWEYSTTLGGAYAPVADATPVGITYAGANTASLSVITSSGAALGGGRYYRLKVTSGTCEVNSVGALLTLTDYCASNATDPADDDIAQVIFGSLVNPAVLPSPLLGNEAAVNTYTDFTALSPASFMQGQTYPISVAQFNEATYYTCWTKVFIDWNQDGDFSDAGEAYNGTGGIDGPSTLPANGIVFSSNITVPITALVGNTRMRIVLDEFGSSTSTPVGCGTYSYGETEDYTINIIAAPSCAGTPVVTTATTSSAGVCNGSTVNLGLTGVPGELGFTYQWYSRELPAGTFAPISGATLATLTTAALTVSSEFYNLVTCSNSGFSTPSLTVAVTVNNCNYTVTRNTGITYNSIMSTGSTYTTLLNTGGTPNGDDSKTNTVSLSGTSFIYNGATVTGFYATSNGWMTFNTALNQTSLTNDLTSTTQNNVLAPFWDDLVIQGNNVANKDTSMRYKIDGSLGSGSAVITVEWAEMERFNYGDPNLNFQVVLRESDNSIEFNYGTMQLFNGNSNGTTFTYSVGMNGTSPSTATTPNRLIQQFTDSANFGTTNQTSLRLSPACNSQIRFVPAAAYSGGTAPSTVPANDNPASAFVIGVSSDPCTTVCGNVYNSKNATATPAITACSAVTPGNADDDVWFSFTADATYSAHRIAVQASPGYNAVVQILDSSFVPVACQNAVGNGLSEVIASVTLVSGNQYYVRVYDSNTGAAGGTGGSGEFTICVNTVLPPPAYDEPAGAISLTVGNNTCTPTASIPNDILRATATAGVTTCTGTPDDDVWYKFTTGPVTAGINHTISVQGVSTFNAALEVYNGVPGLTNSLACVNNTGNGGIETYSSSALLPNTEYYIRIFHTGAGAANGNFSVCVLATAPSCIASPSAPANAGTACESASGTTLSWAAAPNATAYDVYFESMLVSADQTELSWVTPVLTPGTYSWSVVPKNPFGTASGCTTFTFTVNANVTYYLDSDGDGFGNSSATQVSCTGAPIGFVAVGGDCNDLIASINPGATEICFDGIDQNCDSSLTIGCSPVLGGIRTYFCGQTLPFINSSVLAITPAGFPITGYRFEVTNMANNEVRVVEKTSITFRLNETDIAAFGTEYSIKVAVKVNQEWQPYGASCTVYTPAIPTTAVSTTCGSTLPLINTTIYASSVTGATSYVFEVSRVGSSEVTTFENTSSSFKLTQLTGIEIRYEAQYSIRVKVKSTFNNAPSESAYGSACSLFTPLAPESGIQISQCGTVIPSNTTNVFATPVTGATTYDFVFVNTTLGFNYTYSSATRNFKLSNVPGLLPGTTYTVTVNVTLYGISYPGKDCDITTPGTAPALPFTRADVAPENVMGEFKAVAYPNPYGESFALNLISNSTSPVSIAIYDMAGRLLETREFNFEKLASQKLGERYPSGVYSIIVNQDKETQTIRVVKK